jgi:hypothetical protein
MRDGLTRMPNHSQQHRRNDERHGDFEFLNMRAVRYWVKARHYHDGNTGEKRVVQKFYCAYEKERRLVFFEAGVEISGSGEG